MNNLTEHKANASRDFVAAQAALDKNSQDQADLQVWFNTETERLKREVEELERDAKEQAAKLTQERQVAMTKKIMASGALELAEKLEATPKSK